MASLVAILDLKGKPLIQRSYRDDVPPSYIERFLPLVLEIEEEGQQVTPCFTSQGINYIHIRHSNLYRQCISSLSIPGTYYMHSSCTIKTKQQRCRDHPVSPPFNPGID